MKKILIIMIMTSAIMYSQDMRNNAAMSLFSDYKAVRLGDAITVIVFESSVASKKSETSAERTSDIGVTGSFQAGKTPLPSVNGGIGTTNDFGGKGSTTSSGMVSTKISATIDSVLDNGNVRIRGSRKIVINEQEQIVHIKGIVRTSDIQSDNTVFSFNISDAEIVFEGSGLTEDVQTPGLLTKFFHWLF